MTKHSHANSSANCKGLSVCMRKCLYHTPARCKSDSASTASTAPYDMSQAFEDIWMRPGFKWVVIALADTPLACDQHLLPGLRHQKTPLIDINAD